MPTTNIPDGQFFAWLGQFQWTRRLTDWDLQSIFRLDVQLSSQPLLPLEQIAVGGRYSVRGYRENQLVRDNGLIVSLESRLPIVRNKPWADFVQLAPFVDFGRAWNTKLPTPDPKMMVSIGIGLRWAITLTAPFLAAAPTRSVLGLSIEEGRHSRREICKTWGCICSSSWPHFRAAPTQSLSHCYRPLHFILRQLRLTLPGRAARRVVAARSVLAGAASICSEMCGQRIVPDPCLRRI